jgi:translocation and assembly module TamB
MSQSKTIRRLISITLAAIAGLIGGAFIFVHTSVFSDYARGKLIHAVEARTGTRVNIRKLSFAWKHLGVTLQGITIQGRGAPRQAPFFQGSKLSVQVEVAPLLHGNFKVGEVMLDHPVVHLRVNQQGELNIPTLTPPKGVAAGSSSSSLSPVTPLFNLGIRRLIITDGTIFYDDQMIPVSADLSDFGANVRFKPRSQEYSGTIGYKHGQIRTKRMTPVQTAATVVFTASRSGINFNPLTITMPNSRLSLYATVKDYSDPSFSGKYSAQLSTQEVAQLVGTTWLPGGEVASDGTVQYHSALGQTFLEELQLHGTLSSAHLAIEMRKFTSPVNALRASYSLENGNLRISTLRGRVLGGDLFANNGELNLTGKTGSHLSATLTNVSLRDVNDALPRGPYDRLSLSGRANVNAQLSWAKHFKDLSVTSRAAIYSPPQASLQRGQIALNGVVQVAYSEEGDRAAFGDSHLQIGGTAISINGLLSKTSNLQVQLSATDLHQFSQLAARVERAMSTSAASRSFRLPNLSGSARFDGRVYGSIAGPQVRGYLTGTNVGIESTRWRTIQTNIALSPSHAGLSKGMLVLQSGGRIRMDASAGLQDWSLGPSSAIMLRATVMGLQIASAQSLANVEYPVSGMVTAQLEVAGTKQNPSGHGWIRLANASAWKQPITLATINFHGSAPLMHAALTVETPAGTLDGQIDYDAASEHYQLRMNTPGIDLTKVELVRERHLPISGALVASASGSGSLDNPEITANLRIPRLEFHGQTISNAESELKLASRSLDFTANAEGFRGTLQSQGHVEVSGEYMTSATLYIHSISVGMLAARFVPKTQPGLNGSADVHAEIQGPLKDPSKLVIRAEVPAMTFGYQTVHLSLVHPLQMEYRDGVATLQQSEIKGTGIDLTFQGAIPIKSGAPFKIAADGTANMSLLQEMTTGIQSSGEVKVAIAGEGTLSNPTLKGDLRLQNVALTTASLPVAVSSVSGEIRLAGKRLQVASLSGNVNGGSMTAQGAVDIGAEPTFDLAVDAKSVDLNYPAAIRTRVDANLRLNGSTSRAALTGRVVIDYLGFTRKQMDITSLVSQFGSGGGLSTPSNFEKNTTLNIAIQSSSMLSLASDQLSVQGAANLDVVGTLANPVVLGRTTLTGGELFFFGKRYDIQSGTIEFTNPTQTRPSVNLYATTTVNQYKISLHFLGPVDQMKTNFTSTPALPQADIINLLAFGQTTEAAAANPTPGSLGAESVLAQGVAGQISGKIQKLAGISQFSISPTIAASGQQSPGAQVAIQQRVSGRLLVTFTTNTAETQETAVQVRYDLGHGLSVSVLRDEFGGYGVDLHLHKSF